MGRGGGGGGRAVEVPLPERSWEKTEEEEEACLAEYLRNKTALMEAVRKKGSDSLRHRRRVSVSACSSEEASRKLLVHAAFTY